MNSENLPADSGTELAEDPVIIPAEADVAAVRAIDLDGDPDSLREEQRKPSLEYPVVGIGASAGGLQAFQEVLRNLDAHTGMAFVLVTHLAPDQKSYLTEILTQSTKMPVLPIELGTRPEPNHLYVLLPNQLVTLDGGIFRVVPRPAGGKSPMPIDLFLR
jgi:two-component system CheB/CheR fusion protein